VTRLAWIGSAGKINPSLLKLVRERFATGVSSRKHDHVQIVNRPKYKVHDAFVAGQS